MILQFAIVVWDQEWQADAGSDVQYVVQRDGERYQAMRCETRSGTPDPLVLGEFATALEAQGACRRQFASRCT